MPRRETPLVCCAACVVLALLPSSCSRTKHEGFSAPNSHDILPTTRQKLEWPFHVAWGEPKDGLQIGLAVERRIYETNSPICIPVYVRNSSAEPLQVDVAKPELRWPVFCIPTERGLAKTRLHHPISSRPSSLVNVPPGKEGIALFINAYASVWEPGVEETGTTDHGIGVLAPGKYAITVKYAPRDIESGRCEITILPRRPLADEDTAKVRSLAEKHWGHRVVHVTRVHSERLGWYLKEHRIYDTAFYTPESGFVRRVSLRRTVVPRSGEPIYIGGDADAARLLTAQTHEVPDADTALDLALAFAELCGYRPYYDSPFRKRHDREPPLDAIKTTTEETAGGWKVTLPFFHVRTCTRYEITVSRQGEVQAHAGDVIFAVGGSR